MEIRREIEFRTPPEEVWEALTDPAQLAEWFANEVELDPRPGGVGVFRWATGEEKKARVLVADAPERLVLEWEDESEVEIRLVGTQAGTRLLVRESTPQFASALELRALALYAVA